MNSSPSPSEQMTADHWWWREGWEPGTRFLTWHLTFQHDPTLHAHASAYRRLLSRFPQLDLVPDHGLHLTMQGVGFLRDVSATDMAAVASAAEARLKSIRPLTLIFDKPTFTPEAIRWDPQPMAPVAEVRRAVREATREARGTVEEAEDGFTPHVTIAYGNRIAPASPIITAIESSNIPPVTVSVASADLIILGRDRHEYAWEYAAKARLGG